METDTKTVSPSYYVKALSNYAVCMNGYLRTAQELYVGAYMMAENQPNDLSLYCIEERKVVENAKAAIEAQ